MIKHDDLNPALLSRLGLDKVSKKIAVHKIEQILLAHYYGDTLDLNPNHESEMRKVFDEVRGVYRRHPVGVNRLGNMTEEWRLFAIEVPYSKLEEFKNAFTYYAELQKETDGKFIVGFGKFLSIWENYVR